jgi:DNA polymerase III subunit epsilon
MRRRQSPLMSATVVIDFETTGLSPGQGARATEIAAVRVVGGRITERYQSLMRTGTPVPLFIEQLTGISNRMLERAPPAARVMREVTDFARGCALVAHNAGFDRAFWQHEQALAGCAPPQPATFACTMRLARRLYPEAPNHRLGTLASLHGIEASGRAHRALADAEMAAQLWLRIVRDVERRYAAEASHGLLCALQVAGRAQLGRCIERYLAGR